MPPSISRTPQDERRLALGIMLGVAVLAVIVVGTIIVSVIMAVWTGGLEVHSDGDIIIELQWESPGTPSDASDSHEESQPHERNVPAGAH